MWISLSLPFPFHVLSLELVPEDLIPIQDLR